MKTGLHTIDSDDEEENAQNEKKQKYKKLDIEKVKGLEADTYHDNLDEDGNMITGFNLKDEEEEGESERSIPSPQTEVSHTQESWFNQHQRQQ